MVVVRVERGGVVGVSISVGRRGLKGSGAERKGQQISWLLQEGARLGKLGQRDARTIVYEANDLSRGSLNTLNPAG